MTETAAQRLSRLLALVPWLARNDGISMSEAARHFGISPETLERDLWLVVCCGLPGHGPDQLIDIQFWDDDGRINVIDPQTLERPLRLGVAEATALLVGLRMLAQVPGGHDRGAIASATAKLESAAGEALGASDAIVIVETTPDTVRMTVDAALASGRALRLVYAGVTRDSVSERVVDPRSVVHQDGYDYLDAWCRSAEAQRTFRLDRVIGAEMLPEAAAPPADLPPPETTPTGGQAVRLAFTEAGAWIVDAFALEQVERIPGQGGVAVMRAADPKWIVRLALGQAGNVIILEPPELRDEVRHAAAESLRSL